MKEIVLNSGAVLKIGNVPFDAANNLKKAVMKELKEIKIESTRQMMDLYKDYLCNAFSSEDVERCLWECMKRCTYNDGGGDLKIEKSTFEPLQARQDFVEIQMEVGLECLLPFGKSLWQLLQRMLIMGAGNIPQ